MKSVKKKLTAQKNIAVGATKEKIGKMVGNPSLKEEGKRDRVKGNVQNAVESIKGAAKAALK